MGLTAKQIAQHLHYGEGTVRCCLWRLWHGHVYPPKHVRLGKPRKVVMLPQEQLALLYSYYGTAISRAVSDPLGICTTRDCHALVTIPSPEASLEDCGHRMLALKKPA